MGNLLVYAYIYSNTNNTNTINDYSKINTIEQPINQHINENELQDEDEYEIFDND
mgnify:CR=1 FL=1